MQPFEIRPITNDLLKLYENLSAIQAEMPRVFIYLAGPNLEAISDRYTDMLHDALQFITRLDSIREHVTADDLALWDQVRDLSLTLLDQLDSLKSEIARQYLETPGAKRPECLQYFAIPTVGGHHDA